MPPACVQRYGTYIPTHLPRLASVQRLLNGMLTCHHWTSCLVKPRRRSTLRKKVGTGVVLSLRDLQLAFCRTVVGPPSNELLSLVDSDVFSPDERLSIYRNNVLTRLSETLKEAFPVVRRIVGRAFFDYATHSFIEEHLPSEPCLSAYGTRFPQFLKSFPAASQLSYLADVAQLEWSISQVVRAAPGKMGADHRTRWLKRRSCCSSSAAYAPRSIPHISLSD